MTNPSQDYIGYICSLYDSSYDERIENTAPPTAGGEDRTPGEDWVPGMTANHKSLISFQRELEEQGIKLSTSKIKKVLITGGLWTTETSRTIQEMFSTYTSSVNDGGEGLNEATAVKRIAEELGISNIVGIFLDSLNKAFAPWILDSMKAGKNDAIKRMTIPYFGIFVIINIGILLVAPEIVWILGGEAYRDSIFVMPPLIIGCVFQFVYTMYVQVEFYKKKMRMVAIGTSIAALINIGLNYVLIPKFGYIAAGYTTLIGYVVLFLIHYYTVCKLGYKNLYDRRVLFGGLALALAIMPIMIALYHTRTLRYAVLILYVAAIFLALFHYRKTISNFIAGRKR